ncbi:MAG: outer membrane protein assembly factor BamB [Chromatiaceae bacterium]|jgi:outer membrane protein assembly factor BamB|nr:outer membrane protein assembly factor BamB [Chromatiaceae bacterium]
MYRGSLTILSLLLLSGCSSIPWFGGEEDPRPPTELEDLKSEISVNTLWSADVGEGTDKRRLNLIPAVRGDRLYVADAEGRVVAMNAATGKVLWQRETGLPFSGGPEVDGNYIVLGSSDGDLVALLERDGTPLWNARLDSEILSIPRIAGSRVLVHTLDDSVYAFDLGSGDRLWTYSHQAPVLTLRGSSTPVLTENSAIVGISGGKLVNLELETGLPLWETTVTPPHGRSELARIADIDADPVIVEGIVYAATYNGDLAAVDLASGSVLWRRQLSANAGLTASSGVLYVTDSDDLVWAANPTDGTGIWKQEGLKYRRLTAPAVLGNLVAVGDLDGYVHWLDRRDGRIVAQVEVADGPISGRPQVSGGKLFVYGDDGTVAALSAGSPPTPPRTPPPVQDAGNENTPTR